MQGELDDVIAKLWTDARPRLLARVEALEAATERPNPPGVREKALREAHTLIGTLGSFGRMDAAEAARSAETALQQGDDEALCAAVATLRAEIAG
jgi:HPt (histidine-containing phosphotransfer) domain-containing protein